MNPLRFVMYVIVFVASVVVGTHIGNYIFSGGN